MRRLLIYLTYDKQNIVDDYIGYFLQCMRPYASSIAVICNMPKVIEGIHNLSDYGDYIFFRENIGLDAGGFKDALCTLIGWEKVCQYDELILANDSFYGPFDDIGEIFSEMEAKALDFWGLMKRGAGEYGVTGSDPEHILSFFYVFQAPLLHSLEFRSYWESMPYYQDYMSVVKQYERKLTSHFASLGYAYDAYADTAPNETKNLRNQFFQCDYLCYEMIKRRKFPFLKRKQLSYNTLYHQTQENIALSIDYVDKHTDYNVDLIWRNLIRTQNHTELQRSLGLQFILGDSAKQEIEAGENTAIVCVRVKWMNAAEYVTEYLEKISAACDIQVYTDGTELKEYYQEKGFQQVLPDRPDMAVLQGIDTKRYRYICLLHDTDLSSDQLPSCTGKSCLFNVWENLAKDAGYLSSVLEVLEKNPYIGMLMHPEPIFSIWVGRLGEGWKDSFREVKGYLEKLDLKAVADRKLPPLHVTGNFWIKAEVVDSFMRRLQLSPYGDGIPENVCQYLWTFLVQDSGKLTGIVESRFYASLNETNHHYYLKTMMGWLTEKYGVHGKMQEFKEIFHVQEAVEKCKDRYKKWYVYGTGEIARRCYPWIRDTDGYLVSDGREGERVFQGKPVYCLSELEAGEDFGVVLCLSRENQEMVVRLLEEKGIRNYYGIN